MTSHLIEGLRRAGALAGHLETGAQPRDVTTLGRFGIARVTTALRHTAQLCGLLIRHRRAEVNLPLSQDRWGFLRDTALLAVARMARRRVVVYFHGGGFREFYATSGPTLRFLVRRALGSSTEAWVLTPGHIGMFDGFLPRSQVRVLENVADDLGNAVGSTPQTRSEGSGIRLLFLSNLLPDKGCLDLLAALERLRDEGGPDLDVRLVGEADEQTVAEVGRRAAALSTSSIQVELVGSRTGAAKAEEYAWADLFVLPSRNDGQPIVLLEAMSAGVPIVSTALAGIKHSVGHEQEGLIVAPGDPGELAAAIHRLAGDSELRERLGRCGRARYERSYTPDAYYRAVRALVAPPRATKGDA